MNEPYHSQFVEMIRSGAAERDIHSDQPEQPMVLADRFIRRELDRVELHRRSLIPLLVAHGAVGKCVLDVGCSTGGTTAALAMSHEIGAAEVIGVDPNERSIAAAQIRMQGLGISNARAHTVTPGRLPFASESFDLVVCVSVLEFVPDNRRGFLSELQRVARPGAHVYVSTPSPWYVRELHTGRLFGNQRRRDDKPWASSRRAITAAMSQCDVVSTDRWIVEQQLRYPLPDITARLLPWQKLLFRKRP
jgi:2-polyprenyl-3-methyl-5-hydroxy-6-metoxy-1,4-benzoquinol methylase